MSRVINRTLHYSWTLPAVMEYERVPEVQGAKFSMPPKPRKSKRINKKQKERGFV